MNRLDVLFLLLAVAAVVAGWRLGLARRIFGWTGMALGLLVAAQLLPAVMPASTERTPGIFVASAAIMIALALTGHLLGSLVGTRIRGVIVTPRAKIADSLLGAVAGFLGVVMVTWIVLPAMSNVAGWPATEAHSSTAAKAIDATLGRPPSVLDGLSRSLGPNPFPRVFNSLGEDQTKIVPPPSSTVSREVLDKAVASVVKVSGTVCHRVQSGSGFAVAGDLVVTNAHVVAGLSTVTVSTKDGRESSGSVVVFDPQRDLAVVQVRSMALTPLTLGDANTDDTGVILGYPGGGRLTVAPYRIAQRVDAEGRDIYDRDAVLRKILVVGANIAPGDSGGPLIDDKGAVAGVAFAIAPDRPQVAYAIRTEEVKRIMAMSRGGAVATGPCIA